MCNRRNKIRLEWCILKISTSDKQFSRLLTLLVNPVNVTRNICSFCVCVHGICDSESRETEVRFCSFCFYLPL